MAKIKVIQGGCGISYKDEHGTARHTLKTPEHGAFECDDAQAARLVRLGVAAYVTKQQATTEPSEDPAANSKEPGQTPGSESEKLTGHLDAAELESWEYNELKKLAADMGVTPKGKKKADLIDAIVAVEVELGDEVDPDNEDDLPDLNAADPE
jgi:hypothetical protein